MDDRKERCLKRLAIVVERLQAQAAEYSHQTGLQNSVLHHFIERSGQIGQASLVLVGMPTPLQVLCRVLCEDFFLIQWIATNPDAAEEYQAGIKGEMAKILGVQLTNGWGVLKNRHSGKPASPEFMATEFSPKLKAMKTPRAKIEQIANGLGLQKVYDILYRPMSLEVHGNTFDISPREKVVEDDYMALSSIEALLDCIFEIVRLPRAPQTATQLMVLMRLEKPQPTR